jgi:polysaccharide biosynthesis/export protein
LDSGLKVSMDEFIRTRVRSTRARAGWLVPLLIIAMAPAYGQKKTPPQPDEVTTAQTNEKIQQLAALRRQKPVDIPIGTGDVLHVDVFDVPELTREVRVDPTGMISLPLIPGKIRVAGLTAYQAQNKIGDLLRENGLVSHPEVSVVVKEQNSQPVAVVGAVGHVQVIQLVKPTTLLEVLANSGGVADDAGAVVLIVRRSPLATAVTATAPGELAMKTAPAESSGPPETSDLKDVQGSDAAAPEIAELNEAGSQTISIRLRDLLDSGDPTFNIPVYGGDIVSVPRSGIVYVTGAITNPGGYVLQSRGEQVTALKVVALAHGLTGTAKANDAVIVRKNPDTGQTEEIPVKLKEIMRRKVADVRLMPNDILIVPDSLGLKALYKTGEIATAVGTGLLIYRH